MQIKKQQIIIIAYNIHIHIHTVRDNDRFVSLLSYRILSCQLIRIDITLHTIIIRCIIL